MLRHLIFDNAYLVFAALWSALLFSEFPGFLRLVGIFIILAAAILTTLPLNGQPTMHGVYLIAVTI